MRQIYFGPASNFKEGVVYEHEVLIKEKKVKLVLIKNKGRFHCLGSTCTYDGKTDLSKGIVFGDKLMSPTNGSAYSIETGIVEYGPALDGIPIFQAKIDPENGEVFAYIPDTPPKSIRPLVSGRDFNDLRRVVLVGSDPAVISCVETLRQFDYGGDLIVISDKEDLPIDQSMLRRTLRYLDYDRLELRDSKYLKEMDVNFIFDNPVEGINKERGQYQVELADRTNIDFDAVVIATGVSPVAREIENDQNKRNISYFEDRRDHVALRANLEKIKDLTVMGLNMESLELVTTLRREYPRINVTVVDENIDNMLVTKYGKDVADSLVK